MMIESSPKDVYMDDVEGPTFAFWTKFGGSRQAARPGPHFLTCIQGNMSNLKNQNQGCVFVLMTSVRTNLVSGTLCTGCVPLCGPVAVIAGCCSCLCRIDCRKSQLGKPALNFLSDFLSNPLFSFCILDF